MERRNKGREGMREKGQRTLKNTRGQREREGSRGRDSGWETSDGEKEMKFDMGKETTVICCIVWLKNLKI